MALPASGAISLANIQTEFGGSPPTSISEYYRGGGLVTSNNTGVPETGQISISNFYGAAGLRTMYEQVLTGSGTFTPLYAGVPAIVSIGGGGGGGGAYVRGYDETIYPNFYGRAGNAGAGWSSYVLDIDDFSGGYYNVGPAGAGGGGCSYNNDGWFGAYGTASTFNSAGNSPYNMSAGRGGRGGYGPNPYWSLPSDPMSGTYPTDSSQLPNEVIYNGAQIDPATVMTYTGGSGGAGGELATATRPPSGGTVAACSFGSAGGTGFLRIYYLVE
jgi:hypothetical protein